MIMEIYTVWKNTFMWEHTMQHLYVSICKYIFTDYSFAAVDREKEQSFGVRHLMVVIML